MVKKSFIIGLCFIVFLFVCITTIFIVFASTQQSITTNLRVSYTAVDIDGSVSAKYILAGKEKDLYTSDGKTELIFNAEDGNINGSLDMPEETINLTSINDSIVLRYTFKNFGDSVYTALMNFADGDISMENMQIQYSLNGVDYSSNQYALVVKNTSEKYYYIKISILEKAKNAYFTGLFTWLLENYEPEGENDYLNLNSCVYTLNEDGVTYSAAFNKDSEQEANNIIYVPSNFGSARVTKVGDFTKIPENTEVVIGQGLEEILDKAFYQCSNLTNITFASNSQISTIGEYAFYKTSLSSVVIPKSVTTINTCAFAYIHTLSSVLWEDDRTITNLGTDVFIETTSLTSIQIPRNISILPRWFFGRSGITEITIPANIEKIDNCAFRDCGNLKKVTFEEGSRLKEITDYVIYSCDSLLVVDMSECKNLTKLGSGAVAWCSNLKTFKLPDSISEVDDWGFVGLGIESITIPKSLTTIPYGMFERCEKLKNVTMHDNIEKIDYRAFFQCYGLEEITIPASVTIIGSSVFSYCENLESVIFENKTGWLAGETEIAEDQLIDPTNAATLLTSTYRDSHWVRNGNTN